MPLRPVASPHLHACFEGRTRAHDALEVAGFLSEGFGGNEGGRLLVYGKPARPAAPPSLTAPTHAVLFY